MLSPYKFYQYLFNTADADVVKFLKMLTFVPMDEISCMEASMSDPGYIPNTAQKRLAEEVTRFVHGDEGLEQALSTTLVRTAHID
jgi:tyrosyl-tRNA synthetase